MKPVLGSLGSIKPLRHPVPTGQGSIEALLRLYYVSIKALLSLYGILRRHVTAKLQVAIKALSRLF